MTLDGAVHARLGKTWLISLIVTMTAITEHVDNNIVLEGLAILQRQHGYTRYCFRIFSVYMKNRRLHRLRHIRRIGTSISVFRISREANLIIDDNVNSSTRRISAQMRHIEGFGDNSLSGKRGIAMNQQRNNMSARCVRRAVLFRAHPAFYDWIDRF